MLLSFQMLPERPASELLEDRADQAPLTNPFAYPVGGAVGGLGVAIGPVLGGLLLTQFSWPSVFVALVPVSLVAAAAVFRLVPESRDPATPPLDFPGLLTSSVAVGLLVYTVIEAPNRGWLSAASLIGFGATLVVGAAFVLIELRSRHPMLDVSLFAERAFSAASGSVTVAASCSWARRFSGSRRTRRPSPTGSS